MGEDGRIDYVELPGGDLIATKRFYEQAFGWSFTDYGPAYSAFDEGLDGGFNAATPAATSWRCGARPKAASWPTSTWWAARSMCASSRSRTPSRRSQSPPLA